MAELVVRGLVVDRGGTRALDGVDLVVEPGECIAVMGGTGAGKSTLALAFAGLVPRTAGSVDGQAADAVGVVLQRPEATFLRDEVVDEVALAALARGADEAQAQARATALLGELGLPHDVGHRDPLTLSGGEQRRVAVAAALAGEPRVLVLDEPSAGLDRAARSQLHAALQALHAAGRTLVLVTHDPDEAAELATRLVVLRDGRVAWDGHPGVVLGDPVQAAAVGLAVAPEVELLHRVGLSRGMLTPQRPWRRAAALDELAGLLASPAARGTDGTSQATDTDVGPSSSPRSQSTEQSAQLTPLPPLPPLVDARLRIVACAVAVAAALLAGSHVAAAAVAIAAAVVVALARIGRARVRLAVRPLVALAVMLVLLQVLVGGAHEVRIVGDRVTEHPAAAGALRSLQAAAVVLATLALSGATTVGDLAAGVRRLLGPLRHVRVPVGTIAFVVATGLGLVPTFADELERLRLAQRARGIRPPDAGPIGRLRADSALVAPLFVAAFRRAHLLADALAVRGVDPDTTPADWRARHTPGADVLLLCVAVALLVVTRFA